MKLPLVALLGITTMFAQAKRAPFSVVEAGIPEMKAALEQGRVTSRELVTQYLTRIALYETIFAQRHSQIRIEQRKRARKPHAQRSGLAARSSAFHRHRNVHLVLRVRELQGLDG